MVFSFFKKDPKDDKKGPGDRLRPPVTGPRTGGGTEVATRPLPKPIGRPLTGPIHRPGAAAKGEPTSLPEHERAKNHARQTAAKIDQIEAEMARDMLGQSNRGATTVAPRTTVARSAEPTTAAAPSTTTARATAAPDPLEENSGLHGGNFDAIEINTAGGSSAIDEAAILFANGQLDAAEHALREALQRDDLGAVTRTAWHMLFELLNYRHDRAGFDKLTMEYALRFEKSPPAWIDASAAPGAAAAAPHHPAPLPAGAGVRLPESVDAGIVGHLEQLRALTATHAAVQLDVSDVKRIDIAGATLLLRVIGAFKRSQRELTLVGAAELAAVLGRSVESGRRDPSDALWMLLLEVLRMLGRSDDFEEAAIQYCVTFEVSPPQWEPPPAHLKVAPAAAVALALEPAEGSPLLLCGTIEGEAEPQLSRLVAAARKQPRTVIDCGRLHRLSYGAASSLAGALRRIAHGGTAVELHDVGALVGVLLHLLGVEAVASVRSRYA